MNAMVSGDRARDSHTRRRDEIIDCSLDGARREVSDMTVLRSYWSGSSQWMQLSG